MRTIEELIQSDVDLLYREMTSLSIKNDKIKIRNLYDAWRTAKNGHKKRVVIDRQFNFQVFLSNPINVRKINRFIASKKVQQRFDRFNPNEFKSISYNSKGKIMIHTDSPYDTFVITENEFLKLKLSSKL